MTKNAVIYARVSVSTEASVSIERQLEACRSYASQHGWNVVGEFTDDGVSATHNRPQDRPGWKAALEAPGQVDLVIIWKLDRLARRMTDFFITVQALRDRGREIVSAADGFDFSGEAGPVMAGLFAGFAEMEANAIRARVKAARNKILRDGRVPGGTLPYGWASVANPEGPGFILAQDPERIDFVRGAVARIQRGDSIYSVKQWLEAEGAPLPKASQRARKPRTQATWSYATLERLLRNPILAGMTAYNPGNKTKERGADVLRGTDGLPVVDESIAIMTPGEWRAMVAGLDNRTSPQTKPRAMRSETSALLSGLIWCRACDRRMHRGTVQKRPNYYCPECHQVISKPEGYVVEQFLWAKGERDRLSRLRRVREPNLDQLEEVEVRIRELTAQLAAVDDEAEEAAAWDQMKALKEMRAELKSEPVEVSWEPTGSDATFAEDWASAQSDEDRRKVLDDALERVWISRGRAGGRGVDKGRFEFVWKFPEQVGPVEEPSDEDLFLDAMTLPRGVGKKGRPQSDTPARGTAVRTARELIQVKRDN